MKNSKLIIILAIITTSIINISAMEDDSGYGVPYFGRWYPPKPVADRTEYEMAQAMEDMRLKAKEEERARELKILRTRRAREKITMKPFTKVAGIGTLNQLLLQDSDEAREALLNTLPTELKESLIPLIDDRKQLLDRNQPNEAALIGDLNILQNQIQQNLSQ